MGLKKGQINNPKGRPKGSKNVATKEIKDMILNALTKAGGEEYLIDQALNNPTSFLTLVGKIIPKDINASININAALAERIKEARERAGK